MTNHHHMLRLGSVKGNIIKALRHNKRHGIRTPANIEKTRTSLNYCIHGNSSPTELQKEWDAQIKAHGIKVRSNAVLLVEVVFSLPPSWHSKDTRPFFLDCYRWTTEELEGTVLSFDVHLDESAPHAHALIIPVIEGRLQGDKLKGNQVELRRKHQSFASIAAKHGLRPQATNKAESERLERLVIAHLQTTRDPIMNHPAWDAIRASIESSPNHWIELLQIDKSERYANPRHKLASIMTRPQKSA